jgi:hypothetical protein
VTLVLDAGAFLAVERGERDVVAFIKRERLLGRTPVTHGGVVGQVWCGGHGRQVQLARILAGVHTVPLDEALGRRAGILLARSGSRDVIDAALISLLNDGDVVVTSDVGDLRSLAEHSGIHLEFVAV